MVLTTSAWIAAGCVPSTEPFWVVTRPRELAMHLEVVAQGPFGLPIDPNGPTGSEFLPGDTVRATPFVVDTDGPLDPAELDVVWALCEDPGGCRTRSADADLPRCDGIALVPSEPCELGEGPSIELVLGTPPPPSEADVLDVPTQVPILSLVASAPDGPGARSCIERLAARRSLEGCMLMERPITLGPLSEIIQVLEALGYDVELSESLEPLLARPRNHNPGVPRFVVTVGDDAQAVASGARAEVSVGDQVTVEVPLRPTDTEAFEVEIDGTVFVIEEAVTGRWWVDREVQGFHEDPSGLSVRWLADRSEQVRFFFVLRDDRGSETGGWLTIDVRP